MNKSDFYLIKEDFRNQARVASFYDTLTDICDIYPEVTGMTVREARDFMLDRSAVLETKLMESLSVEGIDSSPRDLSCGLSNDDMEQICKSLDRIKQRMVTRKNQ
jgi:hypothetical protein